MEEQAKREKRYEKDRKWFIPLPFPSLSFLNKPQENFEQTKYK